MSELRGNLREEFRDKEYRHVYAEESLNTYIATQIKVLREQRRLTQKQLADLTGMAQPRIAVLEDIGYSSWSISTLKRLAEAFDLRLSVKFDAFSSLIPEIEGFSRDSLQKPSFADDSWFHKKDAQPDSSYASLAAMGSSNDINPTPLSASAKVLSIAGAASPFAIAAGATASIPVGSATMAANAIGA